MSFINRISGSQPFSTISNAIKRNREDKSYNDEGILQYGEPERVYLLYNEDRDTTTVELIEDEECFHKKTVKGDRRNYYRDLYYDYTDIPDDEVVALAVRNGGLANEKARDFQTPPEKTKVVMGKEAMQLDAETRAQVARALIRMREEDKAPRTYLKGPIHLKHFDDKKPHAMNFGTFLSETYDYNFDVFEILDNLSRVDKKSFSIENIERVKVSGNRTAMTFTTKDGKSASLDFVSGRRMIDGRSEDGMPEPFMDFNGPIIGKKEGSKSQGY